MTISPAESVLNPRDDFPLRIAQTECLDAQRRTGSLMSIKRNCI